MSITEQHRLKALATVLAFAYKHPLHRLVCQESWRYLLHEPKGEILMCALCGQGHCMTCYQKEKKFHLYYGNYGPEGWGVCPSCTGHVFLVPPEETAQYHQTHEQHANEFYELYRQQVPNEVCEQCDWHPAWYQCSCGALLCGEEPFCCSRHIKTHDDATVIARPQHQKWSNMLHAERFQAWLLEKEAKKMASA